MNITQEQYAQALENAKRPTTIATARGLMRACSNVLSVYVYIAIAAASVVVSMPVLFFLGLVPALLTAALVAVAILGRVNRATDGAAVAVALGVAMNLEARAERFATKWQMTKLTHKPRAN
jgi:hypothetical protein